METDKTQSAKVHFPDPIFTQGNKKYWKF